VRSGAVPLRSSVKYHSGLVPVRSSVKHTVEFVSNDAFLTVLAEFLSFTCIRVRL